MAVKEQRLYLSSFFFPSSKTTSIPLQVISHQKKGKMKNNVLQCEVTTVQGFCHPTINGRWGFKLDGLSAVKVMSNLPAQSESKGKKKTITSKNEAVRAEQVGRRTR